MKKWAPILWISFIAVAGWVLFDRLRAIDFRDVVQQLRMQPPAAVLGALACCAAAYVLVGIYEGIGVRIASGRRLFLLPFRTALIANPIGRAIGAAMLSGGALRYRIYAAAGLSAQQVAAIIVIVAMPYFFAVGWMLDVSLLLNANQAAKALRLSPGTITLLGALGLAKDIGWLIFIALRKRPLVIRRQVVSPPSLRDALVQIAFGLVQIALMTAMLHLFMPPELNMSWPSFIAVYCIAFIAGQLSNVPAGIGVFEAALLLMLPHVPPAKLVGAVIAYRAIFELLPLLLALMLFAVYESTHRTGLIRRKIVE